MTLFLSVSCVVLTYRYTGYIGGIVVAVIALFFVLKKTFHINPSIHGSALGTNNSLDELDNYFDDFYANINRLNQLMEMDRNQEVIRQNEELMAEQQLLDDQAFNKSLNTMEPPDDPFGMPDPFDFNGDGILD